MFILAALTVSLAGCVEVDGVLDVKPDGSAINRVEIRVSDKVARELDRQARAERRKRQPSRDTQTFAEMCTSTLASSGVGNNEIDVKLPRVPTTGVVTKRGSWSVCTITERIDDPAAHYTQTAAAFGLDQTSETFERLPEGSGYRYKSSIRFVRMLEASIGVTAHDRKLLDELRKNIPASAKLTFAVTSHRIIDTDGALDPDGRTARWFYPLRQVFDRRPTSPPLDSRAVIYFR